MEVARIVTPSGTPNGGINLYNGWFRSYGQQGWYSQTYGGGWYMTDTRWLRAYNG